MENCQQDCSVAAAPLPLSVPEIHIEMSESSEQHDMPTCEPVKLHRVDKPPLRTPRVAGNNLLVIQQDDTITYGSPKSARRRHLVVERTLSADSCHMPRDHLTADSHSPAASGRSSRVSSADKRSRTSSVSDLSRTSSGHKRATDCDYLDDFDEYSDVDEGNVSFCTELKHCRFT